MNKCREGLGGYGVGVSTCLTNIRLCAANAATFLFLFSIFQHGVKLLYLPVCSEMKAPWERQRSGPDASVFSCTYSICLVCINKSILHASHRLQQRLLNLL